MYYYYYRFPIDLRRITSHGARQHTDKSDANDTHVFFFCFSFRLFVKSLPRARKGREIKTTKFLRTTRTNWFCQWFVVILHTLGYTEQWYWITEIVRVCTVVTGNGSVIRANRRPALVPCHVILSSMIIAVMMLRSIIIQVEQAILSMFLDPPEMVEGWVVTRPKSVFNRKKKKNVWRGSREKFSR